MTIIDDLEKGFISVGDWFNSKVIKPFGNKVISPLYNSISRPIRVIENVGQGVETASEVWKQRAGSFTNDVIKGVDNTVVGFGNLMKAPIIPILLGVGAYMVIKK